jgi:hypothetical protein
MVPHSDARLVKDSVTESSRAEGNLRLLVEAQDAEFNKRADCLVNEYSAFSLVANVNGRLTLGKRSR